MKSMKVKRYLQGLLLIICLLVTSCAQIIAVNADEQDVSLEITLEDESTPMEGVIFSMYQITDGITAPDGQSLKFMPDFEDCGYKTDVKTAKELVALSRRLKIWIDEKDIQPTYTLATDVTVLSLLQMTYSRLKLFLLDLSLLVSLNYSRADWLVQ